MSIKENKLKFSQPKKEHMTENYHAMQKEKWKWPSHQKVKTTVICALNRFAKRSALLIKITWSKSTFCHSTARPTTGKLAFDATFSGSSSPWRSREPMYTVKRVGEDERNEHQQVNTACEQTSHKTRPAGTEISVLKRVDCHVLVLSLE